MQRTFAAKQAVLPQTQRTFAAKKLFGPNATNFCRKSSLHLRQKLVLPQKFVAFAAKRPVLPQKFVAFAAKRLFCRKSSLRLRQSQVFGPKHGPAATSVLPASGLPCAACLHILQHASVADGNRMFMRLERLHTSTCKYVVCKHFCTVCELLVCSQYTTKHRWRPAYQRYGPYLTYRRITRSSKQRE